MIWSFFARVIALQQFIPSS